MTTQVTIRDGNAFSLVSFGNGWAYRLVNRPHGLSVWLQDDDATRFREELDGLEDARPHDDADSILSALWDDFEYGVLASIEDGVN